MGCLEDQVLITMMKAMFWKAAAHAFVLPIKLQALPTFVSLFPNKISNGPRIVNVPGIQ